MALRKNMQMHAAYCFFDHMKHSHKLLKLENCLEEPINIKVFEMDFLTLIVHNLFAYLSNF